MILYPQRKEKIYTIVVVISAIFSIILNIIFIPKYYELSTSIVTVFVEAVGVLLLFFFTRKTLQEIHFFSLSNLNYLFASIIQFIVILLFSLLNLNDLWITILAFLSCLVSYILVLFFLNDYVVVDFIHRLKSKLKTPI